MPEKLPKHFWQPPCPFKNAQSKQKTFPGNQTKCSVLGPNIRTEIYALPVLTVTHTQHLDVNKKHGLRPYGDHVPLLCYTLRCLPLAWPYHSQKKHIWKGWATNLKHSSRCYWCISQIPLPDICPSTNHCWCWLLTGSHLHSSLENYL